MNLYGWTMMDEALRQENRGIDLLAEGEVREEPPEPQDTQTVTEEEIDWAFCAAAYEECARIYAQHVPDRVRPA